MKLIKLLYIPFILILFSCNKENNELEIIKPKPYFPVYPKSWWTYNINDSATITSKVSSDYMLHSYQMTNENWHPKETFS